MGSLGHFSHICVGFNLACMVIFKKKKLFVDLKNDCLRLRDVLRLSMRCVSNRRLFFTVCDQYV